MSAYGEEMAVMRRIQALESELDSIGDNMDRYTRRQDQALRGRHWTEDLGNARHQTVTSSKGLLFCHYGGQRTQLRVALCFHPAVAVDCTLCHRHVICSCCRVTGGCLFAVLALSHAGVWQFFAESRRWQ